MSYLNRLDRLESYFRVAGASDELPKFCTLIAEPDLDQEGRPVVQVLDCNGSHLEAGMPGESVQAFMDRRWPDAFKFKLDSRELAKSLPTGIDQ